MTKVKSNGSNVHPEKDLKTTEAKIMIRIYTMNETPILLKSKVMARRNTQKRPQEDGSKKKWFEEDPKTVEVKSNGSKVYVVGTPNRPKSNIIVQRYTSKGTLR